MKRVIPEKAIENQILHYLYKKKIFAWKNQSTGVFDPIKKIYRKSNNPFHIRGVADILGILPDGRFLAIEVKSQTGRASEEQKKFIWQINARGGKAFIAKSIEDVDSELSDLWGDE